MPVNKNKETKITTPEGKGKIKVGNLAVIDPSKSLPVILGSSAFYAPQTGTKYWPYMQPDDNLFKKFLELRLLSLTQANCINDKTLYSIGEGLIVKDGDKGIADFPPDFDKKINTKGQTIDTVLKAVFESIYQDGNKFIEITRVKIGGTPFVYAFPHNNLDCRFVYDETDEPTQVIRSREFRRDGVFRFNKKDKLNIIPIWSDDPTLKDSVWVADANGVERTMLVVKNEVQGIEPYGLPSNFAGMIQALSEYKVGKFNIDNFDNNMFLAGVLSIIGQVAGGKESDSLLRDIRDMYIGEGNNLRIFTLASEGGDLETKFTPFQQQMEGHFVDFDKHNEGKIVNANGWSKELLDMQDQSGLGKGGQYLAQLFQRKFRTVIRPVQRNVLDNFIFPLMKIKDEFQGTKFYDLLWDIKPVVPVSIEGDIDLNSILTVDEGRDEIGLGPHKDPVVGGKQIVEIGGKQNSVPGQDPTAVPPKK